MPKIKITRIDKSLPLPTYETNGAVGFDLLAREDMTIDSGEIKLIPGNVIVECPKGYMLAVASRSSTPKKKGLTMPHGFGVIDRDYCGPEDEIKLQMYNFTKDPVQIHKGDKIAQGLFVRVDTFEFEEMEQIKESSRGGFGSTGGHRQPSKALAKDGQEKKPEGIKQQEILTAEISKATFGITPSEYKNLKGLDLTIESQEHQEITVSKK